MRVWSIEAKLNAFSVIARIKWRMHSIPHFLLILYLVWKTEFLAVGQNMSNTKFQQDSRFQRKRSGGLPACGSGGRGDFPLCSFSFFYFLFLLLSSFPLLFVSSRLSSWSHPLIFLRTSFQPFFSYIFGSFRSAAWTGSSHQREWLPLTGLSTRLGSTKDRAGWQPLQKQAVGRGEGQGQTIDSLKEEFQRDTKVSFFPFFPPSSSTSSSFYHLTVAVYRTPPFLELHPLPVIFLFHFSQLIISLSNDLLFVLKDFY